MDRTLSWGVTDTDVGSKVQGFQNIDGILGIGPAALTGGTQSNSKTSTVPTVTDNLFKQGAISSNLVGISFNPITKEQSTNGELTFGGTDPSKYTGSINYVPITKKSPANSYWGVDQSVSYGNTEILSTTGGIVDTGTTLVMLATGQAPIILPDRRPIIHDDFHRCLQKIRSTNGRDY